MKILLIILSLFSLLFSNQLYKSKIWLSLLHYHDSKSTILNDNFFLSKDGKTSPQKELTATIKSFKSGKNICKFPARYLFLSDYYKDFSKKRLYKCKQLQNWSIVKDTASISAVFVSGFLGNPASAFGHSFLKMNKSKDKTDLFDITISYGAKLPKKYTMLSYIYKGVTGGYIASYTDKYYYLDDMVYSNKELRQMWEYRLKLDKHKKDLLLYHLWELRGVHFKYYFFNRNCGYKVSELLDLVEKREMKDSAYLWYAPIETFYKLDQYNLVTKKIYHPSKQQKLYAFYDSLSKDEKKIVYNLIKENSYKLPNKLSKISKIKIYDFLISYYKYKNDGDVDSRLLLKRINLPVVEYKVKKPKIRRNITDNNKMSFASVSYINIDKKNYTEFAFGAFSLDPTGYNNLDGDMMSVGKASFVYKKDRFKIRYIDFLNIRRLKINQLPFDKETPLSWKLKLSYQGMDQKDFFAKGGIGYSWKIPKHTKFYTFLDTSIHSKKKMRITPNVGLFINKDKLKTDFQLGIDFDKNLKKQKSYFDLKIEYSYKSQKSIYISSTNKDNRTFKVGLKCFF